MGGRLLLLACVTAATLTAFPRIAAPCSTIGPPGPPRPLPPDGATNVPTNARIVVEWQGGVSCPLDPQLSEVVVRASGGSDVTTTAEEYCGAYRYGLVFTPDAPLEPNTAYEILGRPSGDPLEVIATFTTGSTPDVDSPVFAGLAGAVESFDSCVDPNCTCDFDWERITAWLDWSPATDATPQELLRYNVYRVGQDEPVEPMTRAAAVVKVCSGDTSEQPIIGGIRGGGDFLVRAVDLAGNEDANTVTRTITIDCTTSPALPDAGALAPDAGGNTDPSSGGCCAVAGGDPTGSAALALLVLVCLARRRCPRDVP